VRGGGGGEEGGGGHITSEQPQRHVSHTPLFPQRYIPAKRGIPYLRSSLAGWRWVGEVKGNTPPWSVGIRKGKRPSKHKNKKTHNADYVAKEEMKILPIP